MTTPSPKLANTSVCPRCGAGLRCGNVAGDAQCWCSQLPNVMPVPAARTPLAQADDNTAAASCFCPACLKQITNERKNTLSATDY
ncbi:MAG: cysteine-rich CWC family protein [Polaromonas sp.]